MAVLLTAFREIRSGFSQKENALTEGVVADLRLRAPAAPAEGVVDLSQGACEGRVPALFGLIRNPPGSPILLRRA